MIQLIAQETQSTVSGMQFILQPPTFLGYFDMTLTKFSTAAALVLMMSAGAAMAAPGGKGNGNGNSGNGQGNGGGTTPVMAACAASDISVAGASCIGFITGNLNGNNPSLAAINQNVGVWGLNLTSAVASTSMLSGLTGTTIDFSQQLYGDTIISIHYGNVTDVLGHKSTNVTAFYRFDAGSGAGIDSFTTQYASLSNATLYQTGGAPVAAVPEPATYAMLFAGLGLMGLVARRRKQK
jgi:hypothetical protein